MNRSQFLIFLSLTIASSAMSQTVSVSEAMNKALSLRHHEGSAKAKARASSLSLDLVYTAVEADRPLYYVFNYPEGGFAIIGGDEVARDVLGYCESGVFDRENIPDGLDYMLKCYESQIQLSIEQGIASANARGLAPVPNRVSIQPLITTQWNQGDPYNCLIPHPQGTPSFVTGCVATALSQVMKFHEWPITGIGSYSYNINYNINNNQESLTFSADFDNTNYRWDDMLDVYASNEYTSEQASAVGQLMYHVGVSVDMEYGWSESGAQSWKEAYALTTYFGYDKGATLEHRDYYSDQEWESMIYNELVAHRPVLYSGQHGNSGHAFICHGYDAERDFYAFNWGWGGYCDGYYPLTGTGALQPNGSGIGGAGEGSAYTSGQLAVIGVTPNKGTLQSPLQIAIYKCPIPFSDGSYTKTIDRSIANADEAVSLAATQLYNVGYNTESLDYGIMLVEKTTGKAYVTKTGSTPNFPASAYFSEPYSIFSFNTSLAPYSGEYDIYPVCRKSSGGDWVKMYVPKEYSLPCLVIENGDNDAPIDILFSISDTQVEVDKILQITASPTYKGKITYTSANPAIATVDENGIVTGKSIGTTDITVVGEATSQYNETTKTFKVSVVEKVLIMVPFTISNKELKVGQNAVIETSASDYDGGFTFVSDHPEIATVDEQGNILALSAGSARIVAQAAGSDFYLPTVRSFLIHVSGSSNEALPTGLVFTEAPYIGCDNNAYDGDLFLHFTLLNNSSAKIDNAVCYYTINMGNIIVNGYGGFYSLNSGSQGETGVDLAKYKQYLTPGAQVSCTFYSDESKTMPMNYPSITFTYCSTAEIEYVQKGNQYGTLCLPFDAAVPAGIKAYECVGYAGGKAILEATSDLKRNTPYIISGTEGSYSFYGPAYTPASATCTNGTMVGILQDNQSAGASDYVLTKYHGLSCFAKPEADAEILPKYSAVFRPQPSFSEPRFFLPILPGETEYLPGDCSGDGVVSLADIPALVKVLISGQESLEADVNEDGRIDSDDMKALVNILLGKN